MIQTAEHLQDEVSTFESSKPTAALLELAKKKGAILSHNQSIRLLGSKVANSYYLYRFSNMVYIGYRTDEPLTKFFANRAEYAIVDTKTGATTATIQQLIKVS